LEEEKEEKTLSSRSISDPNIKGKRPINEYAKLASKPTYKLNRINLVSQRVNFAT